MGKPRETREKSQLTLEWTESLHWADLPPPVTERLRFLLRALLSEAVDPRGRSRREAADERG